MIMHPYRPRTVGKDLNDYQGSHWQTAIRRIGPDRQTKTVMDSSTTSGNGRMTTRIVPKLSYVTGIEPWGWIVGTGIYLEDVRIEIGSLKKTACLILPSCCP